MSKLNVGIADDNELMVQDVYKRQHPNQYKKEMFLYRRETE